MRIFWDLFENGTIAKQYYVRRCSKRTSYICELFHELGSNYLAHGCLYIIGLNADACFKTITKKQLKSKNLFLESTQNCGLWN